MRAGQAQRTVASPISLTELIEIPLEPGEAPGPRFAVYWQVLKANGELEMEWEPAFFQRTRNAPGGRSHDTLAILPADIWRRSRIALFFEDIDRDGKRDGVLFLVPLRTLYERFESRRKQQR